MVKSITEKNNKAGMEDREVWWGGRFSALNKEVSLIMDI